MFTGTMNKVPEKTNNRYKVLLFAKVGKMIFYLKIGVIGFSRANLPQGSAVVKYYPFKDQW